MGRQSVPAHGPTSRSARDGLYRGLQSHSAAASRSISLSTASRRHGRRDSCSLRPWQRRCWRGTGRSRFRWRWAPPRWRPGWRRPPSSAPSSPTRCSWRRYGTSISPALSRPGKSVSARIASWCASSAWPVRGLAKRWSACESRYARARRRRSARSSSSRRDCLRRSNHCAPAAMTSRARCTSTALAPQASCSAASASPKRRMRPAFGCDMPWCSTECARRSTSASAPSCPATRVPSHRPSLPASATRSHRR